MGMADGPRITLFYSEIFFSIALTTKSLKLLVNLNYQT